MNVLSWLAAQIFRCLGWKIIENFPKNLDKAVVIMAPHTSNWDLFYGMLAAFIMQVPTRVAVKKEAMFFPLGRLLKWIGAIPIDRKHSKLNQVSMMVQLLQNSKKLALIITPEGTRSYALGWKTGFYQIAMQASVPLVLGYLDYAKKHAGVGPIFYPTGDLAQDMPKIQAFYRDKVGKYPAQGVR